MFHSDGSVIVSFVVYFKTPVTANEGLSKLRGAVENNRKLGNFTVGGLKLIQPVNPTTAALTEESTSAVCISTQKGDVTVKKDILGSFCNHEADGNKNANNHFMDYLKTQRKFPCRINCELRFGIFNFRNVLSKFMKRLRWNKRDSLEKKAMPF